MHPHFRDVTDHIIRVQSEIDTLRELLAFAFEAGLMVGQNQCSASRRLGRDPGGAGRGRRYLRDEFQAHARIGMGVRVFRRRRSYRDDMRVAVPVVPTRRLAVTRETCARCPNRLVTVATGCAGGAPGAVREFG